MAQSFEKDPDETTDYTVDWETRLAGDTISTSDWTVQSGLTEVSDSNDTTSATVFVSGGTAGACYTVANKIVTAAGRTWERTIYVNVKTL